MKTKATALLFVVTGLAACGDGGSGGGGDSDPGTAVIAPADLEFVTFHLPSGTASRAYTATLEATGGTAPYQFQLHQLTLPSGLSISATGVISGVPSMPGAWSFFLRVTDWVGTVDVKQFDIIIGQDFLSMGAGWQAVSSGSTDTLTSVDFPDANTGWFVGYSGTIRRTTNGGVMFEDMMGHPNFPRWGSTHLPSDPSGTVSAVGVSSGTYQFTKVDALSATTAWVGTKGGTVNGYVNQIGDTVAHILRTTDGSATWDRILTLENEYIGGLQAVSATDARIASRVEAGAPSTFVSIGANSAQWHVDFPTAVLHDTAFAAGSSKGVLAGQGIWRTSTSGSSWTACSVPANTYRAATWVDGTTVIVVGNAGAILRSTDSGTTWTTVHGGGSDLYDVSFSGTTGWAVGLNGTIYRSTNGGASWTAEYAATSQHLYGVSAVNSTTAWAVGAAGTCIKRQ